MSEAEYRLRLQNQGGVCGLCGKPETSPSGRGAASESGEPGPLSVDHDHRCCPGPRSCGKCTRALICRNCNLAIGRIESLAAEIGWPAIATYLFAGQNHHHVKGLGLTGHWST